MYDLQNYPDDWKNINNVAELARGIFALAALQALVPFDNSQFLVSDENLAIWVTPTSGRQRYVAHPWQIFCENVNSRQNLIEAIRCDKGFLPSLHCLLAKGRGAIAAHVRQSGLSEQEAEGINLNFSFKFLNNVSLLVKWST